MPINDLQASLLKVGEIRCGDFDGNRPKAIDAFRFTSASKNLIQSVADEYGGEIRPWGNGEWEVYTEAKNLDVLIPNHAGIAFGQDYQLWAKTKTGRPMRLRLCDGDFCDVGKQERVGCICRQTGDMKCSPVTRLSLILPKIPGLGVWRFYSRSRITGSEMKGVMDFLFLRQHMEPIPAELALTRRETTQMKDDKVVAHNFTIVELHPRITFDELRQLANPAVAALEGGSGFRTLPEPEPVAAPKPPAWEIPEGINERLALFLVNARTAGFVVPNGDNEPLYMAYAKRVLKLSEQPKCFAVLTLVQLDTLTTAIQKMCDGTWTQIAEYKALVLGGNDE